MLRRALITLTMVLVAAVAHADSESVRLAVLIPENLTDSIEISTDLAEQLLDGLRQRGIGTLEMEETRAALRAQRIRSIGTISARGARALAESHGATQILAWSILYHSDRPPYETTVCARLLSAPRGEILAAWTISHARGEKLSWIGRPEITSRDQTAEACGEDLLEAITASLDNPPPPSDGPSVALVSLDAWTRDSRDARRASRLLANTLFVDGWKLVEPGESDDVLRRTGEIGAGGISASAANALFDRLHVDWIVTGSIDQMSPGSGSNGESAPRMSCGLRWIDAQSARPRFAIEESAQGDDQSGLFGRGELRTLGRLSDQLFARISQQMSHLAQR